MRVTLISTQEVKDEDRHTRKVEAAGEYKVEISQLFPIDLLRIIYDIS